ncbi:hypothetical protein D1007_56686 [Hordeum vulgare]|nr:hypothetical protein D1007_56686 [Hordeum vulgare]
MDGVKGMLKGLKLSKEEKKGVKNRFSLKELRKGELRKGREDHAVGKVLTQKFVHSDAILLSLGKFVEAYTETDGSAIGRFMTITIWMQIDKSLMRGFTLETNDAAGRKKRNDGKVMEEKAEEDDGSWCRFEYEFLPDFCYRCGIIGHGEKDCEVRVYKGDMKQYGRWLRADMSSRRSSSEEGSWRSGSMGVGASRIYGHRRFGGKVGGDNDNLSWRKDGSRLTQGNDGKSDKGEEVTSPTKVRPVHQQGGKPKILVLEEMQRSSGKGGDDVVESGEKESAEGRIL